MGIKVIEALPGEKKNEKRMEQLKADMREIIEKRIQVCEIVGVEYSESAMRDRIKIAMSKVLWDHAERDKDGILRLPHIEKVLQIKGIRITGETHWYVTFDTDMWDEEWKIFREKYE
jgi:hypothetical protein